MNHHLVRRFAGVSLLVVLITLAAAACASSGHPGSAANASHSPSISAVDAACHKIQSTLATAPATLAQLATHPAAAGPAVTAFVTKLSQDAAGAATPVQLAVRNFTASVRKALASLRTTATPNIAMITSQLIQAANSVTRACQKNG